MTLIFNGCSLLRRPLWDGVECLRGDGISSAVCSGGRASLALMKRLGPELQRKTHNRLASRVACKHGRVTHDKINLLMQVELTQHNHEELNSMLQSCGIHSNTADVNAPL